MDKEAAGAVRAYFNRVKEGTATEAEIAIFPAMLEKWSTIAPAPRPIPAELIGMSPEGLRGGVPKEGLINADEVCRLLGKHGLKKNRESLMRLVRAGRLPKPRVDNPSRWAAEDIWEHLNVLRGGGAISA